MHYAKPHSQHFLTFEKMSDVGAAEITAGGTVTFVVDGKRVLFVFGVIDVYDAVPGIEMAVSGIS